MKYFPFGIDIGTIKIKSLRLKAISLGDWKQFAHVGVIAIKIKIWKKKVPQ
jgi:hypothetical protein